MMAENRKIKDIMSKNDSSSREMDDQTNMIIKLEQKVADLTLEKDEMLRNRKEREAKITELNRKYTTEKESATQLRQVYQPKLKETIGFQRDLAS